MVPVECLSLCPRPCGVAISSPGAWTYLFGDQAPESNEILACVETYLAEEQGHLPRYRRPTSMQASIMGRVPPLNDL
jgi:predicted metal-binding protein